METANIFEIIFDSLSFIEKLRHSTIVVKYGGAAQTNQVLKEKFAKDIVFLNMLGIHIVVVHGGGRDINTELHKIGIESEFKDGVRITSMEAMRVIEMVLSGRINKELSNFLNFHGGSSVGICGKDGRIFGAKSMKIPGVSEHFTGEISEVNPKLLYSLLNSGYIPVVSPIAYGEDSSHIGYNINADLAACSLAKAMKANKVIFLTDIEGVLDEDGKLIPSLNEDRFKHLQSQKVIEGGMIPKINACLDCVKNGVEKAHIVDGRVEHSIMIELFTSCGIGTEVLI